MKIVNLLYFLPLIFLALSCKDGAERIEGIPVSDSYNKCSDEYYDFGDMITIGDPGDKFMIRLPYNWDIQETYSDTLYGIIASNTLESLNEPKRFQLISVTGYQTKDLLVSYFKNEIKLLKKDKNMKVLEVGTMNMENDTLYWVKFERSEEEHKIMNIVKYIKSEGTDELYLIQTTVYKSEDYMDKLCYLKGLVDSFELVDNN